MTTTSWKTYAGVLPAALAITDDTKLRYLGLALLCAQLWQLERGRRLLLTAVTIGLAFVSIQIAPLKQRSNPVVNAAHTLEARLDVPPGIETILNQACKDCHSNETKWPLYAKVAPVSWIVERDVERGRRAMNLSEWPGPPAVKPAVAMGFLTAACADVTSQRMPPAAYRSMHAAARLYPDQAEALCDWTSAQTLLLRVEAKRQRALLKP